MYAVSILWRHLIQFTSEITQIRSGNSYKPHRKWTHIYWKIDRRLGNVTPWSLVEILTKFQGKVYNFQGRRLGRLHWFFWLQGFLKFIEWTVELEVEEHTVANPENEGINMVNFYQTSYNSVHVWNNPDPFREFVQTAQKMDKYLLKNWSPSGMWRREVWEKF